MGIFDWLQVLKPKRQATPEVVAARRISESISQKASLVQKSLEKYSKAEDPFAAMLTDLYEHDHERFLRALKNGSAK